MFGRLGPVELILILIIALVIFGPSKLPQIGRSLGEAIKEFKKGTNEVRKEFSNMTEPEKEDKKEDKKADESDSKQS